jgi:hypothetical protein
MPGAQLGSRCANHFGDHRAVIGVREAGEHHLDIPRTDYKLTAEVPNHVLSWSKLFVKVL